MKDDVVQVHDKGRVRTIVMNRPDKMNALSHELAWAIVTEVQRAAHDDDVWAIAITGNGRAFCAGLDLSGPGDDASPLPLQERLMDDISWVGRFALVLRHECDKPVIAGLNGVAAGAGLSLAMAADMRIARKEAGKIGLPEVNLGVLPGTGGTQRMARLIGKVKALEMMIVGKQISFDTAKEMGLVNDVWDATPDAFWEQILTYAKQFCPPHKASMAVGHIKRCVQSGSEVPFEYGLALERELQSLLFKSSDAKEGISAYVEKRMATFKAE